MILDGSLALRKAATQMFGQAASSSAAKSNQLRNVLDHLPESRQAWMTGTSNPNALAFLPRVRKTIARELDELLGFAW